jgi:ferredoxin-NADP reductase
MSTLRMRVVSAIDAASGVRRIRLAPVSPAPLQAWDAGSHIDVILPSGLVRQYSLCGGGPDELEIAVLRQDGGRGGSVEVHEALTEGAEVLIGGPRNHFVLEPAPAYVFVAGGIGITPILPMIVEAERLGADWLLFYGGRTRGSMAFVDQVEAYGQRVSVVPQDELGLIDLATVLVPRPDTLVYCCGPEPLLSAVESHCRSWGGNVLRTERFSAPAPDPAEMSGTQPFEVQLGEDGPLVDIPADQSILQTLLDAGTDVLYSCEEGTCGSCEVYVLAGRPNHRDMLLTDSAREMGAMLICVSRSLDDRLVLDLEP